MERAEGIAFLFPGKQQGKNGAEVSDGSDNSGDMIYAPRKNGIFFQIGTSKAKLDKAPASKPTVQCPEKYTQIKKQCVNATITYTQRELLPLLNEKQSPSPQHHHQNAEAAVVKYESCIVKFIP